MSETHLPPAQVLKAVHPHQATRFTRRIRKQEKMPLSLGEAVLRRASERAKITMVS